MQPIQLEDAARRIRADYAEMPGLSVTFWQARRLWSLPEEICRRALALLTRTGFLVLTPDGCYRRPHPERSIGATAPESLRAS